jgi:hypothetical protein
VAQHKGEERPAHHQRTVYVLRDRPVDLLGVHIFPVFSPSRFAPTLFTRMSTLPGPFSTVSRTLRMLPESSTSRGWKRTRMPSFCSESQASFPFVLVLAVRKMPTPSCQLAEDFESYPLVCPCHHGDFPFVSQGGSSFRDVLCRHCRWCGLLLSDDVPTHRFRACLPLII